MLLSNSLGNAIDLAGQKIQYDENVINIFLKKRILAWILKGCAEEFRDLEIEYIMEHCIEGDPILYEGPEDGDVPDFDDGNDSAAKKRRRGRKTCSDSEITGDNTVSKSQGHGPVIFDIRFTATVPDRKVPIQLLINLEPMKSLRGLHYPHMKRAVYYASRMISDQKYKMFEKDEYGKLRKVYSIWITMDVGRTRQNTINCYRLTEEHIVGSLCEKRENYDLLSIVVVGLGDPDADSAANNDTLRMLDILLSASMEGETKDSRLEGEFDISLADELGKGCGVVFGMGDLVYKSGLTKGREEGRAEGFAKSVYNLMKSAKKSIDEALDMLGVSDEDRPAVIEQVNAMMSAGN